jgi:ribosomal protein S18 acetylase RimI-like enzyme
MKIQSVTEDLQSTLANEVPELMWATGPVSYDYHFADRALFDAVVLGSWHMVGTLFAADVATLALDDEHLMGIEIGMPGAEYRQRQTALAPVWQPLLAAGEVDEEAVAGVLERSQHASWLNPVIPENAYYIHALSVKPEFRGKRVGYHLIENAMTKAREQGFTELHLDVLSDNPAVEFYRGIGLEVLAETRAPLPSAFGVPPELRMAVKL